MLNAIIRNALHYRPLVLVLSAVCLLFGGYLAVTMPIDVFPDLDRPRVIILSECPGLATEEVETLVSQLIETSLLGAPGVEAVRSQTSPGLNVVYVEFSWSTTISAARQTVQERLTALTSSLPEGVRPVMTPPASIMGQIMIVGLYRQRGPDGGELYPIHDTDYLAELTTSQDRVSFRLWDGHGSRDSSLWTPIDYQLSEAGGSGLRNEVGSNTLQFKVGAQVYDLPIPSELEQQIELRSLADWTIRPRIRRVTGVAEVLIQGGERKQYQVLVDPAALIEYGVTLTDVEEALRASNVNSTGGFAIEGEIERPIRVIGRLGPDTKMVIQDLKKVPIRTDTKRSILLEQVAQVVEGAQLKRGDGGVDGHSAIVFTVVKQPHVDTRDLTSRLEETFHEIESTLPCNLVVNSELFQLKRFIDRGVFNVVEALVIGAVLVLIILFLFLLSFRITFITLTAIPLSLATTAIVFRIIGHLTGTELSINVMTLGGIAVAMGELVDDAIVDVENIFRRLKDWRAAQSRHRNQGESISEHDRQLIAKSALRVVYEASTEIRSSVVFGTAVVILVFVPLFALSGVEGRLFMPLSIAYIVSILASLLISMTVTPVMGYYLLRNAAAAEHGGDSFVLRSLKKVARHLVRFSMAYPFPLLIGMWCLFGVSMWKLTQLGRNFLPPFDEGSIQVNVSLPPGSSLNASNFASKQIDDVFRTMQKTPQHPAGEILHFARRTGRAELDEHAAPVNLSEYLLNMNPDSHSSREEIIDRIQTTLRERVPGVDIEVEQPLAHLISHMVSGVYAQIAVKIQGDDIDVLQQYAREIKQVLNGIEGLTPPIIEPIQMTEELHIRLRGEDLAFHGLTRAYVGSFIQTALNGEVVSQVLEGPRRFDLLVRIEETYRSDYANLGRLRLDMPDGRGQIELRSIADIEMGVGPNAVNRDDARRRIVIRCNTRGRDMESAIQEIQSRIAADVALPVDYFLEYTGQFENARKATLLISLLSLLSIAGMFVVLLMLFPSPRIVLQILNALPVAFVGGVVALIVTNQSLTIASLVGFISLGGIAVRNGILLVTHYFHLMEEEGEAFSKEMILRGSIERLAPVLMTALTAGIGLVPLVVGGNEPGREILYPVATVILGGLITSTFCEFLIHPGLFWNFSGRSLHNANGNHDSF